MIEHQKGNKLANQNKEWDTPVEICSRIVVDIYNIYGISTPLTENKVVCFYFYHPGGAPGEDKIYTRYID